MSDKRKVDSVEKYREERKKQLNKAKKLQSGKGLKPKTKRLIGRIAGWAAGVLVCLGVLFLIASSLGVPQRIQTAVTVAGQKISVAEYNYFYRTSINNFLNQYSSMLEYMGLDTSKDYAEQVYDQENNLTWADFFHQQTLTSIQQVAALCNEADKEGIKLTDEDKDVIKDNVDSIKSTAKSGGGTTGSLLQQNYGKGTNLSVVKKGLGMYLLSNRYTEWKTDQLKPDANEVENHYNENKDDFDVIDYRSVTLTGSNVAAEGEELTDEQKAENKQQAKTKADGFLAAITDEASFNKLAQQNASEEEKSNYDDPDATLISEATKSTVSGTSEEMANWLFDSARKAGDKSTFEVGDAYYVVLFQSRARYDYNTVDVRHILMQFETTTDEEGNQQEPTEEAKAAAKTTAEEIYNTWKNGDQTEESFSKLATEKTQDPGSASNGGLYEQVGKGQMVETFDAWIFDPARKPGDNGIVETSYGYHIMYFVGESDPYWQVQVSDALTNTAYNEYLTALMEEFPVEAVEKNLKATQYGGK